MAWSADSERVFAQVQRRDQRSASLIGVDARTGERCDPAPLVIEYPPAGCGWVNLAPPSATFRELRGEIADPSGVIRAGDFLWGSWRTGHLHLYVHCGSTGVCKRAVSAGDWSGRAHRRGRAVGSRVLHGHRGRAAREAPVPRAALGTLRGRRLFDLSVDGASHPARRLEPVWHGRGVYEVRVRAGAADKTPTVTVHETKATATTTTVEFGDERAACSSNVPFLSPLLGKGFDLAPPTPFEVTAADGATKLHGVAYVPDERVHGPPPYPCVVSVYGGPHAQTVQNAWHLTTDIRAVPAHRSRGICVLKLDNRGSARRGAAVRARHLRQPRRGGGGGPGARGGSPGAVRRRRPDARGNLGWSYGGFPPPRRWRGGRMSSRAP